MTESESDLLNQGRARGRSFAAETVWHADNLAPNLASNENPFREFFNARQAGRGIWKWDHYFEAYDRHFSKFRGLPIHFIEIGVYSGGSLDMWRDYFGPQATIYGVDIEPACKAYEADGVKIFIGDQADRNFWNDFRQNVPQIHAVVDDGGHQPEQQMITLEELFLYLQPGGVFMCEDVHGSKHAFTSFVQGMIDALNDAARWTNNLDDNERRIVCASSPFQAVVNSICCYPYLIALERNSRLVSEFVAPKKGTVWQPFFR